MLTQEHRANIELIKNHESKVVFITIPKGSKLEKKVKVETEKVSQVLQYISTDNIITLNELINTRAKLVCDKIRIPLRNPNRYLKPNAKWG